MHVFHSSHLNHLPGKELDLKSLAYTASKGKIGTGFVEAETLVALSSLIGIKPTGRERTAYLK